MSSFGRPASHPMLVVVGAAAVGALATIAAQYLYKRKRKGTVTIGYYFEEM